ncbi:MAG TPA: YbhB/YbcL family Raf kinase inhibitor-like protein [Bryobacteraceae bacterium]|nr:YbhB/YbcL family Raf kinase inhibitor-like protein [Bryobacteraceae bacterium]
MTTCLIGAAMVASAQDKGAKAPPRPGLTVTSPAFADGAEIPQKYTQSVPTPVSPKLEWTNVPANTVSFVLLMHDPDVALRKTTNDQLHWLVLNIPGDKRELEEGVPANPQLPDGSVQLKNGGNTVGYRGPGAPAPGPHHHYTIELFALDTKLDLGPDATRPEVLHAMDGHILGKGVLVGRFHR